MFPTSIRFRKACITGGAGFIGTRLSRRLLTEGLEVVVLDNLSVGKKKNLPGEAVLVVGDILDSAATRFALEGCDIVFHLAARVAIRSSFDFVVEDAMTNVVGTAAVMKEAAALKVRKVVATSSMAVYSDAPTADPIDEDHPTRPVSPYGISKLALEQLVHAMASVSGMESTVVRLFNTYGPGQRLSPYVGVVTIFANRLLEGSRPCIFGNGEQARDFVHVDDVVSGLFAAMNWGGSGETFNIGTGTARTVNQVFRSVAMALGSNLEPTHGPTVPGELRYSVANIGKAVRLLGYRPARRFDDAIGEVVHEIAGGRGVAG